MYINRNYTLKSPDVINAEEEKIKLQEHTKMLNEQRDRADLRRANYNKFLVESKDFLITEAMNKMLLQCLPDLNPQLESVARNCCEIFVKEEGSTNILRRCKSTLFLNEFCNIVEETYKSVIHGAADEKEDVFQIDNSTMKGYYNKLRTLNYEPMCNTIITRVAEAEKDFVASNIKDRAKLEDAAEKAKEKVDAIKAKDEDSEEKIKEEFAIMYKKDINNINNRSKNILESIISHMGEGVVKNDSLRGQFVQESGKLNANRIIDTAEVMYTFLEMVNTTGIKDVDASYIESVIKSIK